MAATVPDGSTGRLPLPPERIGAVHGDRFDERITPSLGHVLRRAVDIANGFGHTQVHVEHVALAILEDPESPARRQWTGALTAQQWQLDILCALLSSTGESEARGLV